MPILSYRTRVEGLLRTDSFKEITIYELFSAGGESDEYYLSKIGDSARNTASPTDIRAIAFLALDIHTWIIDSLLAVDETISIPSVISIVGICNQCPETKYRKEPDKGYSKFKVFPLFDVSRKAEITYIKNQAFYPYFSSDSPATDASIT